MLITGRSNDKATYRQCSYEPGMSFSQTVSLNCLVCIVTSFEQINDDDGGGGSDGDGRVEKYRDIFENIKNIKISYIFDIYPIFIYFLQDML